MKLMKLMKLMKITVIRSIEVIIKLSMFRIRRHLFLSESKNIEVLPQNCEVIIKLQCKSCISAFRIEHSKGFSISPGLKFHIKTTGRGLYRPLSYSLIMGRTVEITEKAYQALTQRSRKLGMSRKEYLSKLVISQPLEEPKGTITPELPKKTETEPNSARSQYARWMRGEDVLK